MTKLSLWVIEATESPIRNPDYFVCFSAGRCYLTWSDELEFAMKFFTRSEAFEFAAKNRLHCGFRIMRRQSAMVA